MGSKTLQPRRVRVRGRHAALLAALLLGAGTPARAEWVPVRDVSLEIARGSPLDFSTFAGNTPIVDRVVAGPSGHLALASRPDEPVRFLCAALAWTPPSGGFPDHATADRYAEQLRAHGYNMARFHFVDLTLMSGRAKDFDYDPVQLDRFRYLLAVLKRQGIRWIFDGMTHPEGAKGDASPDRWDHGDLKLLVHVDAAARRHWSRLVETLYASVNPYTGLAPLRDPALALVVLVNENGAEFDAMENYGRDHRPYSAKLLPAFNRWLATRYGTTAALRAAWPTLGAGERIENASVELPASWDERGPRMRDTQLFVGALNADTNHWMAGEIRRLGYVGLTTQYNNMWWTATDATRAALPVVAQDTYFDEIDDFRPGAALTQKSSLDDAVGYLRAMMGTRWFGKPFGLTEWGHVFPNRFRHEAGIAVPAYAALQGWDFIDQHSAGAVDLEYGDPAPFKTHILPYEVGLDPVARASETLAALLFRRGDAAEAPGAVAVPFGAPGDMLGDGRDPVPDEVTRLGLLARLGLQPPGRGLPDAAQPALTVPLSDVGHGDETAAQARLDARVAAMRASGMLPAANRTDPDRDLWESQTGQLLLNARDRSIAVVTPRTEAVSLMNVPNPRRLGTLTVDEASAPCLVAASALDGSSLGAARRILLVVATDAINSGMTFRDAERHVISDWGRLPVLIERATIRLRLTLPDPGNWSLTSLHLDGSRGDPLPLSVDRDGVAASIDNAAASHGPTTYWVLERRS